MSKIISIHGRQLFDSRGYPTIEAEIILENGIKTNALVPSGASTGSYEAVELRDEDPKYLNKGVLTAVNNINSKLQTITGMSVYDQTKIDQKMISIDGSKNKSNIGANAILAVSIAICKAGALSSKKNLFEYISESASEISLPYPMLNIINGGAHADNSLKIQEFMIRPDGAKNFSDCLRMSFIVIQKLKEKLHNLNLNTNVGDEGGFAPSLNSDEQAIEMILSSIEDAGLKVSKDINICLDIAANELYENNKYKITKDQSYSSDEIINFYENLVDKYPIVSIEDALYEDDWETWSKLNSKIGKKTQIVGDLSLIHI